MFNLKKFLKSDMYQMILLGIIFTSSGISAVEVIQGKSLANVIFSLMFSILIGNLIAIFMARFAINKGWVQFQ